MTMKWFGTSWGAPMNETCPQVDVPAGATCIWCEEPILPSDAGVVFANGPVAHRNCFFRQSFGSVGHIEKRCTCFMTDPESTCSDPEGMTKREAANAAVEAIYELLRKVRPN